MFLKELISQGWRALLRDHMRSALLGIVWGLASVVLLLAYEPIYALHAAF